jgi:hypothetical protein
MAKYAWEKFDTTTNQWTFDRDAAQDNWLRADVNNNGIVRWKSNGRVPFDDALEAFAAIGKTFNMAASNAARERDADAFFDQLRRSAKSVKHNSEMAFEMRAAFGEGADVVDVITGQRFKT